MRHIITWDSYTCRDLIAGFLFDLEHLQPHERFRVTVAALGFCYPDVIHHEFDNDNNLLVSIPADVHWYSIGLLLPKYEDGWIERVERPQGKTWEEIQGGLAEFMRRIKA